MKNLISKISLLLLSGSLLFTACSKDNNNATPSYQGKVKLEFFNDVGSSNLILNHEWYTNANGDSFTVSKFNYYISNIKLTGPNNASYTEDTSYHLIQQGDSVYVQAFDLNRVPPGDYNSITFMIGVDSLHNVSGAQTGALDPINGMFWTWHTGYIMVKFEGNSPQSNQAGGYLEYHCGGYSGVNNVIRTVTLSLPQTISVTKSNYNHIHVTADVDQLFDSPNKVDFSTMPVVNTPGANAKMIADNYANMFRITYSGL